MADKKKLHLIAQNLGVPDAQVVAIQTAVTQITAALETPKTIVDLIGEKIAELQEIKDLLEVVTAADMPEEENEKEDKKEGGKEEKGEEKDEKKPKEDKPKVESK